MVSVLTEVSESVWVYYGYGGAMYRVNETYQHWNLRGIWMRSSPVEDSFLLTQNAYGYCGHDPAHRRTLCAIPTHPHSFRGVCRGGG